MDLRMLGALAATTPEYVIRKARTFADFALLGMALTGSILFSAEASHVALNPVFQFKVALIVLGLAERRVFRVLREIAGCEFEFAQAAAARSPVCRNCVTDDLAAGRGLRPQHRLLLTLRDQAKVVFAVNVPPCRGS